jgi:anti-anti-sigma regulatory factor
LRARIVLAADQDEAIILDATETEAFGQAALQLLIAAEKEADRLDIRFAINNVRPSLLERLETLGLAEPLGLTSTDEFNQEELPQ